MQVSLSWSGSYPFHMGVHPYNSYIRYHLVIMGWTRPSKWNIILLWGCECSFSYIHPLKYSSFFFFFWGRGLIKKRVFFFFFNKNYSPNLLSIVAFCKNLNIVRIICPTWNSIESLESGYRLGWWCLLFNKTPSS